MRDDRGFERGLPAATADIGTGGAGLPVHDGSSDGVPLRYAFTFRAARRWYVGSIFGLAWLLLSGYEYFASAPSLAAAAVGAAAFVTYAVAFVAAVPLARWMPRRHRIWVIIGLLAASFLLWPMLGWGVSGTWTLVGVAIAMSMYTMRTSLLLIGALTLLAVIFELLSGARGEAVVSVPAIIASISAMMLAFSRQIAAINQLRATQHELAHLAVEKERGRVARDIHDILGHSLTAITVRAELAGMLIDADESSRAAVEIAAVEGLARGALADVRSTVAGYRGVNVVSELANAKSILASAGIEPVLPTTVDDLGTQYRELAGWVVREGVTNVVRHSGATRCRIRISQAGIEVDDDGRGPASSGEASGSGLRGLGERVEAAGGVLRVGRSDLGGFSLSAGKPVGSAAHA